MTKPKKYSFNRRTLSYELEKVSPTGHLGKALAVVALSFAILFSYMWATSALHKDLPKTFLLRMANVRWQSRIEVMARKMDAASASLDGIARRDDEIYRSIFGLSEITPAARNAGISGARRYEELDEKNPSLAAAARRLDLLLKKAVVQSRSFDESEALARRAGEIAVSIPAICPLSTEPGTFRFSSPFGMRNDPVYKGREAHAGIDLASYKGNPIYATGDGVVESAEYNKGYGNSVIVDHGFGYKTRYAHMNAIAVRAGQKVSRGTHLGYVGTTGKSTGNHLHYEVIFRGRAVNPEGFMDMEMPYEDWRNIVTEVPVQKGLRKQYR